MTDGRDADPRTRRSCPIVAGQGTEREHARTGGGLPGQPQHRCLTTRANAVADARQMPGMKQAQRVDGRFDLDPGPTARVDPLAPGAHRDQSGAGGAGGGQERHGRAWLVTHGSDDELDGARGTRRHRHLEQTPAVWRVAAKLKSNWLTLAPHPLDHDLIEVHGRRIADEVPDDPAGQPGRIQRNAAVGVGKHRPRLAERREAVVPVDAVGHRSAV